MKRIFHKKGESNIGLVFLKIFKTPKLSWPSSSFIVQKSDNFHSFEYLIYFCKTGPQRSFSILWAFLISFAWDSVEQ